VGRIHEPCLRIRLPARLRWLPGLHVLWISGVSRSLLLHDLGPFDPLLTLIHVGWGGVDAGHFLSFIAFELGVVGFFFICRRLVKAPVALGATLLLATQPMLYGQAFINQKDIPFMALLAVSVALGMIAVEKHAADTGRAGPREPRQSSGGVGALIREMARHGHRALAHPWLSLAAGVLLVLSISSFVGYPYMGWIEGTIRAAYAGKSITLVNEWFGRIANNASVLSVDAYLHKASALYDKARLTLAIGFAIFLPILIKSAFPESLANYDAKWLRRNLLVVAAGAAMGMATSIRVAGPLAGLLVSVYFVFKAGRRAIQPLVAYAAAALCAMYATWPFLWDAPIARFNESLHVMANYPGHDHILFDGVYWSSSALPWDYIARLMAYELTIPALGLFVWGAVVLSKKLARGQIRWGLAAVPILWLGLPFLAFIVRRTPIYDNLRQVLFAIPPVLLIGAFGLEEMWRILGWPALRILVFVLLLFPAVYGVVSLHPYEYAYYNQFVGGVNGVISRYELDYWCTSYREAMAYINDVGPENAKVVVWGPLHSASDFARPDLQFFSDDTPPPDPQFALRCRRTLPDPGFYADYETVMQLRLGSAVLTTVNARPGLLGK